MYSSREKAIDEQNSEAGKVERMKLVPLEDETQGVSEAENDYLEARALNDFS